MAYLRDHLQKLRAFAVVAQLGSFRKAATRLRISQPALSQSVQILESVVGKPLLVRTSRGVVPTEEGLVVRAFADRLALDLEGLEQKLLEAAEPMSGHVRIGSFESLTISLLPGFLAHAHERFPKLVVSVTSGTFSELSEMLLDRRIQLAVSTMPKDDRHTVAVDLFSDHYRFFMDARAFSKGTSIDKRSAARLPLIVVPDARDDAGHTIPEYVEGAASRRRATIELSTFEAVKAFALHGVGIGVLPTLVARDDVLRGRLREVQVADGPADGFGEHRIVAHSHARERADLRLARLLDELKRYAAPLRLDTRLRKPD